MHVVKDLPQATCLLMTDPESRVVILGTLQDQFTEFKSCGGFIFWPCVAEKPPERLLARGIKVVAVLYVVTPSDRQWYWIGQSLPRLQGIQPCVRKVSHREMEMILGEMFLRVHPEIRPVPYTTPPTRMREVWVSDCLEFVKKHAQFSWDVTAGDEGRHLVEICKLEGLPHTTKDIYESYRTLQLEWMEANPKPPCDPYSKVPPTREEKLAARNTLSKFVVANASFELGKGPKEIEAIYKAAIEEGFKTTRSSVKTLYYTLRKASEETSTTSAPQ